MIVEQEQRRSNPRLECRGEAELYRLGSGGGCAAAVLDLSVEGCLLKLEVPLLIALGEAVEIGFTVNKLPFRVRAEVRVVRQATTLGFQFVQLSARARVRLSELIEELIEDRKMRMRGARGRTNGIELAPLGGTKPL